MIQLFNVNKRVVTPFTLAVLLGWGAYGITVIIASFFDKWVPDPAFVTNPWYIETIVGLFITVGSVLIIMAELPWKKITSAWLIDKIGMGIAMGGWGAFSTCVLLSDPTRIAAAGLGLSAFFALVVRFFFAYSSEQWIKRKVHRWNGSTFPHSDR